MQFGRASASKRRAFLFAGGGDLGGAARPGSAASMRPDYIRAAALPEMVVEDLDDYFDLRACDGYGQVGRTASNARREPPECALV